MLTRFSAVAVVKLSFFLIVACGLGALILYGASTASRVLGGGGLSLPLWHPVNIVVLGGLFLGMLLLLGTILIAWVADKIRAGRRG
jgi:hypothetical protein